MGYSMGGAAVIRAAAQYGIFNKIVLDSTFTSPKSVAAATILKPLGPLKHLIWKAGNLWVRFWTGVDLDDRPTEELIADINRPMLLIHGKADQMIPYTETKKLYEIVRNQADLWIVDGYGHVASLGHQDYRQYLQNFFTPPHSE